MPIVFEQPGPFDAASSQGGGAAQQYGRDVPSLVAQQRTLAGLYEAMAAAHRGGGGVARQVAAPDSRSGGAVQAGGAYHYQQPDPLTQAESMRLQRLQSARSAIQDQVSQGMLSAEDGNQMLLQVQTGIDPLRQRQEASRAQMLQEQAKMMQHQRAQMTAMDSEDEAVRTADFMRRRTVTLDGQRYILDHRGDITPMRNLGVTGRLDPDTMRVLGDINQTELGDLGANHRQALADQAQRHNHEIEDISPNATPEERTAQTADLRRRHREEHGTLQATHAREVADLRARHRQLIIQAAQGRGVGSAGNAPAVPTVQFQGDSQNATPTGQQPPARQQPPAGGQPQPVGGQPAGEARPFERGSPGSPEQRAAVERFDDLRSQARGLSSPDTREAVSSTIDQAEGLLTRFGSPAAMPAAERQQYTRLVQGLAASFPSQGISAAGLRRAGAAARRYGVPDEFVAPLERYGSLDAMTSSARLSLEVAFNRAAARRGHRATDTQGLRRWLEARSREE